MHHFLEIIMGRKKKYDSDETKRAAFALQKKLKRAANIEPNVIAKRQKYEK